MISAPTDRLLHRLCFGREPESDLQVAMVVAHPDDEVIGAGAQLPRWRGIQMIHVTDGAPRDLWDATAAGFTTREEYAQARREELEAALALADITPAQLWELDLVDQEASQHLRELAEMLVDVLRKVRPAIVLTHPYEGGHPDHDATAFGVHAACQQLQQQVGWAPAVFEMSFYFNRAGIMASGEFLPHTGCPATTLRLTEAQLEFKRQLYERFTSQGPVLSAFPLEHERFRMAPHYDFTLPPHEGVLYYELFDWGMSGKRWRGLAQKALEEIRCQPTTRVFKPSGLEGVPSRGWPPGSAIPKWMPEV